MGPRYTRWVSSIRDKIYEVSVVKCMYHNLSTTKSQRDWTKTIKLFGGEGRKKSEFGTPPTVTHTTVAKSISVPCVYLRKGQGGRQQGLRASTELRRAGGSNAKWGPIYIAGWLCKNPSGRGVHQIWYRFAVCNKPIKNFGLPSYATTPSLANLFPPKLVTVKPRWLLSVGRCHVTT